MIREVLQRPGRLRMRLTVVAAASALFALVVLAALVLPSLQHNLEQSRVASLRASIQAAHPEFLLPDFGETSSLSPAELQSLAASAGVARITVFTLDGFALRRIADSSNGSPLARRALQYVRETANLHHDTAEVTNLPGGRTAVLTFSVSSGGVDGVVLAQAPLADVQEQVSAVERRLVFGGALAFGVALLAGALAAEPLARRLARLRAAADRIARGSFSEPIVDSKGDEIGELARSLEEMRSRLGALERARSAFIANASHELRTPLTALGGYLELLAEGGLSEAERDEFLETMSEQVQRLTKLATDLLDLSRLDSGGFTVADDELELSELASDAAREMQALAARRGSTVVARTGEAALARGDEGRVLQVLRVLVDNAVRHTPPGTTVTLSTETTPWGSGIVVSDNGPGIPPELLERVFERFFRGPGAAARGTGLGLAIARELAERMEGRLLVTSGSDGTRFTLELPGPAAEGIRAYTGHP
jgi:signal transduction histidine kinase